MRRMENPSAVGSWWRKDANGQWEEVQGYPDHMNQHQTLPSNYDAGGVHIFSNIHNKAAHGVLTAAVPGTNEKVFTPQEIAVLYYLALGRLSRFSEFSDARRELLSVAKVMYGGSTALAAQATAAIEAAYDAVGIQ